MINATVRRNPYIVGSAISDQNLFFGRERLFQFIEDNLKQGEQVILLHGQRRIGKSSVLFQIPNFVGQDEFAFVPFDLQNKSRLPLSNILYSLAKKIVEHLKLDPHQVRLPTETDLEREPNIFSNVFLPEVYQALDGKKMVWLLDEFDVLSSYDPASSAETFFPYLQSMLKQHEKLFILPVVGRQLDDMPKLLSLFRRAPNQEIGLLSQESAKRLITEPAKDSLVYDDDAIQAILELSSGHPYFTQLICHALFAQARTEQNWQVTRDDVEKIIDEAIEIGEGGLAWFWDGLPILERVVFSAVAEAQNIAALRAESFVEEPLTLLQEYGVAPTERLAQAGERLVEWGFLDFAEGSDLPLEKVPAYKVKIELVRRWLVKRHPLRQEIRELENLEPEAHNIYKLAADLRQRYELLKNAIPLYEQALAINPNYFRALFDLAEGYLDIEDFGKAVELYKRAYQVEPTRTQEGFVRSLLGYGLELMQKRKFELAKEPFTRILVIQPDNEQAQQKLKEIEAYKEVLNLPGLDLLRFYKACNPNKILSVSNAEDLSYYIDFSSARGSKAIEALGRTITRLSPDEPTCQLFTGYIGSGKSTELLRLEAKLAEQGFHVVYFESSQDLVMTDVDLSDILLAIARQISESLDMLMIDVQPSSLKSLVEGAAKLLQTEIEFSTEASVPAVGSFKASTEDLSISSGIAKITAKAKNNSVLRNRLRQYLEPRRSSILDAINQELIQPGIEKLTQIGKAGLVVIVDNLDRLENTLKPIGRPQAEYLFVDQAEHLKKLKCHIVYTMPLGLTFSKEFGRLRNYFGVDPEVLHVVPVRLRDGTECHEGMALMRQMVLARAFPNVEPGERLNLITEVFESPATLDRLCSISAGHVRNLLGILYRWLKLQDPPLSRDCLEQVIRQLRDTLVQSITEQEWELLSQVNKQHTVVGELEYQTSGGDQAATAAGL
jgi:tetratricopeptide (TPR) repeat protein